MTKSLDFLRRDADNSPMFIITNSDHDNIKASGIALVKNYTTEADGVWIWMGYFAHATAVEITPGMVIKDWILWTRGDNHNRTDLEVIRVNRKSITVKALDDDTTHKIEITY